MDQNQTVDNDLQKAIDDITNTTSVDPVFSDPVAAPSSVPENDTGELDEPVGPFPEPQAPTIAPDPTPIAPLEPTNMPDLNIPELAPAPTPVVPTSPTTFETPNTTQNLNMHQIKEAALRDLIPLLNHLSLDPTQKFNLYRDIFENLKDYTVLEPAYNAAKEIPDENKRAEALLYLVESIDKI